MAMTKLLLSIFVSSFTLKLIEGHGFLSSPRCRNFYAHQEGTSGAARAGVPPKEFNHNNINRKQVNQVCGTMTQNYDDYRDSLGNPMPWIPQGVYSAGQDIDIEIMLTQHARLVDNTYFKTVFCVKSC